MASFRQWSSSKTKLKRVTWVCGSERVLVEEIVDYVRGSLVSVALDYTSLTAGEDSEVDIWAAMNQFPFDPTANKLVLIRDAERIKRWGPLLSWLDDSRRMPTTYLCFVSSEHGFYLPKKDHKAPSELPPHLEWFRDKSGCQLIKCAPLDVVDAAAWLQTIAPMSENVATHLFERVGGDLGAGRNVARKLSLFDGAPTTEIVDILVSESPTAGFVEDLLALKKPRALLALETMPETEYSRVVGFLDSKLDMAGKVHHQLMQRRTAREIATSGEVPAFLVSSLMRIAKFYDAHRRNHCRQVLAVVDAALRQGAREGVMEAAVALW